MKAASLNMLLGMRLQTLRNMFAHLRRESILKIVVVAVLGTGFWVSLFFLASESIGYLIGTLGSLSEPLLRNMFSLFFLTLCVMLTFSNALISFSNLFRNTETAFLFSLPFRHDTIYLYKMLESLVFSSWALFALGLPLLIAYGVQTEVAWYFYPAMVIFLIPFVVLPAALGALIGLGLTAIIPRHRGKMLGAMALVTAGFLAWYIVDILRLQSDMTGMGMGSNAPAYAQLILAKLEFTQHPLTPNYWITHGLLGLARGTEQGMRDGYLFLGALASSALFFLVLGWFVAGAAYEGAYSKAVSTARNRRIQRRWFLEALAAPIKRRWPAMTVLVIKDVKTFFRDPVQWSQALIFFGLLLIYIANLRNFGYQIDRPFYQNLINFLNLGATCLTLATMVSRFVFPLISLEGQRFWVLGLVPVPRRRILWAKFAFSFGGALVITESLVLLSNYILAAPPAILILQLATAALICLALTGMAVGMGALFPSLKETNPSKIVSGFGGTLTLILSIGLVILVVFAEAVFCQRYLSDLEYADARPVAYQEYDKGSDPGAKPGYTERLPAPGEMSHPERWGMMIGLLGAIALVTFLAAYIPLSLGARALDRMEF